MKLIFETACSTTDARDHPQGRAPGSEQHLKRGGLMLSGCPALGGGGEAPGDSCTAAGWRRGAQSEACGGAATVPPGCGCALSQPRAAEGYRTVAEPESPEAGARAGARSCNGSGSGRRARG